MAAVTEERISSDAETSFVQEKLSTSKQSITDADDDVKSDAVLDEIAAKVNALNFKKSDDEDKDFTQEPETEANTMKRQSDIIKKQAETINTLIQQLRVMFDEYNAACHEKDYYEDLSEALLRYIEICEGKVIIEEGDAVDNKEEESIFKLVDKDEEAATDKVEESSTQPPNPTPEKQQQQSQEIINSEVSHPSTKDEDPTVTSNAEESSNSASVDDDNKKPTTITISNAELIRLNHILLKEIIELRNERDVLRDNTMYPSDEDDSDVTGGSDTDKQDDEENHVCEHCSPTSTEVVASDGGKMND